MSAGGIIPAYAGSTYPGSRPCGRRPDHPRIRGEHSYDLRARVYPRGSSPHTRGAPGRRRGRWASLWIIPAYAGSTLGSAGDCLSVADHPRIRGEHKLFKKLGIPSPGSSPHTRGARRHGRLPARHPGIIPAYAGSTTMRACSARSGADHPRIRGEHASGW